MSPLPAARTRALDKLKNTSFTIPGPPVVLITSEGRLASGGPWIVKPFEKPANSLSDLILRRGIKIDGRKIPILDAEGHHATNASGKLFYETFHQRDLELNMKAAGKVVPGSGDREHWSPHHIIPGATPGAGHAIEVLRQFGVSLDDADNGIWLPNHLAADALGRTPHSRTYGRRYGEWVSSVLRGADSEQAVRARLAAIEKVLESGGTPWRARK